MRNVIWTLALLCSACTSSMADVDGADSPYDEDNADPVEGTEAALSATPVGEIALPPAQLKKCIAGPFTTSAYGNRCPSYAAVASALCSLSSEFIGGTPLSHDCQPIPGSIPQQYFYTLSYQCTRPQPCRY
jgi:hypothetical protein